MVKLFSRVLFPAMLVLLFVSPAGAAFTLPEESVIDVSSFAFPNTKTSRQYTDNGVDLTAELQQQITGALQAAGFTIASPDDAVEAPAATENPALVRSQTGPASASPHIVTSQTGPATDVQSQLKAAEKAADEAGKRADELEKAAEIANTKADQTGSKEDLKKADAATMRAEKAGQAAEAAGERAAALAEKAEKLNPANDRGDRTGAEELIAGGTAPVIPAVDADKEKKAARYKLTGRVTLYNERIGTPTRIGSGIRVRVESALRCSYKVTDIATGKVLISSAASGSGNRLAVDTDVDSALQALQDRVFSVASYDIASRLSGKDLKGKADYVQEDYADSPGKRLKPAEPKKK